MCSAVGFPVVSNGEVVGVMEFFSRERRAPDRDVLEQMATITTQAADFVEKKELEAVLVQNQAKVREQHERFQAILDNAPAVIFANDLEGRFLFVNRQFQSLFRLGAEEAVGRTNHDLVPAEAADAVVAF